MTLKDKLIADAEDFCLRVGMSLSRLSSIVVNEGTFFKRLSSGRDCTTTVYERFQRVFTDPAAWEAAKAADRERRKKSPPRAA